MKKREVVITAIQKPIPGRENIPDDCVAVDVRLIEKGLDHVVSMLCKKDDSEGMAKAIEKALQMIIDNHDESQKE